MMERLMDEITDTERIQLLAKVIVHLKRNDFKWNDIYLATTTPGQQYRGTFAGTDGNNFFFRDEQNRIFVGKLSDLNQTQKTRRKGQLRGAINPAKRPRRQLAYCSTPLHNRRKLASIRCS